LEAGIEKGLQLSFRKQRLFFNGDFEAISEAVENWLKSL
jgi:hypothetical protein